VLASISDEAAMRVEQAANYQCRRHS
jgi:hypothetical protein